MVSVSKDKHFLTVIIPTLGRESISDSLAALDRQTRKPDEILVILDKDRKGAAWARNQGIIKSRGDLVAFTDDDCIPPEDWLETLVRIMDEYNVDGVGGTHEETDTLLRDQRLRRKIPSVLIIDDTKLVGMTANVMYKKEWLDLLKNRDTYVFNEKMVNSSDNECAWRLRRYGARLAFVPKNVIHIKKMNAYGYFSQQYTRGIGIAHLYLAYNRAGTITHQKSLVWGPTAGARWVKVLYYKILGPFDVGSFTTTKNFIIFWVGEKIQGIGFIYCLLRNR